MHERLALSGLTPEDAKLLRLTPIAAADCGTLGLTTAADGFKIPYWRFDGQPDEFFRVRFTADTRSGFAKLTAAKPQRYAQPKGSVNSVYAPPYLDWTAISKDPEVALVITEGELKAAAACREGIPTLGLGGVWVFMSKKARQDWLALLGEVTWEGRTVYICYDSDAASNPDVLKAESALADRLLAHGARPYIARLPPLPDGAKCGLDDFLVARGASALTTEVFDCAYEYEASTTLHDLNTRLLYVRDPGLVYDRELQQRITCSAFTEHAFSNVWYYETRVDAKGNSSRVKVQAAPAWLKWEFRAECRGLDFRPGEEEVTPEGRLNTWTGWGVPEPAKGDISPWRDLLDHLFANDPVSATWFEQWCAYPLQHPGAKLATAVLIWGIVHGSGKTLVGHTLMRIYGERHSAEIHDSDLENLRNEWAENKQFVLADDIVAKGDRALMRKLMTMVTQKTVRLDPKYIPSYSVPDLINYYFTSNEPDALYLDEGDRRFFVHETHADKYPADRRRAYVAWRDSDEGIAALWHHLLHVDLSGFDPQAEAPMTLGKSDMTSNSKSELGTWLLDFRRNTDLVLAKAGLKGDFVTPGEILALYDPSGTKRMMSANVVSREMKRMGYSSPSTGSILRLPSGRQVNVYVVRNYDYWKRAPWKEACKHFAESRPSIDKPQRKEKY